MRECEIRWSRHAWANRVATGHTWLFEFIFKLIKIVLKEKLISTVALARFQVLSSLVASGYHNHHRGTFPSLQKVLLESTGSDQRNQTTLHLKFKSTVEPHLSHYMLLKVAKSY